MGQAKQRGTREQRIASATPKPKKLSADERRAAQEELIVKTLGSLLSPIFGTVRR